MQRGPQNGVDKLFLDADVALPGQPEKPVQLSHGQIRKTGEEQGIENGDGE